MSMEKCGVVDCEYTPSLKETNEQLEKEANIEKELERLDSDFRKEASDKVKDKFVSYSNIDN